MKSPRTLVSLGVCILLALAISCRGAGSPELELTEIESPAGPASGQPRLTDSPTGGPILSWVEEIGEGEHALYAARFDAGRFSAPRLVASGRDWFVNWADVPSVLDLGGGHWAAHWLEKRAGGKYSYDVVVALSDDEGASWGEPLTPHKDGTATEHGFVTLYAHDGELGLVWLDGRRTAEGAPEDDEPKAMTLRAGRISLDGELLEERQIDSRVCDCCQTGAAVTSEGPLVAYRDRSRNNIRDISTTRLLSSRWTSPKLLANDRWGISGCPVNGPSVAAHGDQAAIVWFTAADGERRVQLVRSIDAGKQFNRPIRLAGSESLGRVDLAFHEDGRLYAGWLAQVEEGRGELRIRSADADRTLGPVHSLVALSTGRESGLPQIEWAGEQLLVAWTDAENGRVRVGTWKPS